MLEERSEGPLMHYKTRINRQTNILSALISTPTVSSYQCEVGMNLSVVVVIEPLLPCRESLSLFLMRVCFTRFALDEKYDETRLR